jgi:hypothetical protein
MQGMQETQILFGDSSNFAIVTPSFILHCIMRHLLKAAGSQVPFDLHFTTSCL